MASGYAIESTRRESLEESKDWRYDNDNFLVAVVGIYSGAAVFIASGSIIRISKVVSINIGDSLTVLGSASNDGTYTVASFSTNGTLLLIVVNEAVINEISGSITLEDITSRFYLTELYSDSFTGGSGMTSLTTAYNLRLTPARMLLAHMNVITACIQVIQGLISFIKGEGNTLLQVAKDDIGCQEDYSGEILSENQSFDWDDADVANIAPLWLPEIYKFEYPLTAAQLASVRSNPLGYIQVTDDHGNVRKGFILDFDFTLKTGLTKFELLKVYE